MQSDKHEGATNVWDAVPEAVLGGIFFLGEYGFGEYPQNWR